MVKTKRWTKDDKSVFFCEACQRFHYRYSPVGQRHKKFEVKKEEEK